MEQHLSSDSYRSCHVALALSYGEGHNESLRGQRLVEIAYTVSAQSASWIIEWLHGTALELYCILILEAKGAQHSSDEVCFDADGRNPAGGIRFHR